MYVVTLTWEGKTPYGRSAFAQSSYLVDAATTDEAQEKVLRRGRWENEPTLVCVEQASISEDGVQYIATAQWLAPAAAATLGSSTSAAKAAAARQNGRKGGRPRKK